MNATEIDTSRLEQILSEECKCESTTHLTIGTVCSVRITHRVITACHLGDKMLCQVAANTLTEWKTWSVCAYCSNRSKDCWTIIPV